MKTARKPSTPALTPTTTHDDGQFIRTALVIGTGPTGSVDVVLPSGERLCQVNLSTYPDGRIIVDVIDVDDRFAMATTFIFTKGQREAITQRARGALVSADFKVES